MKTKTVSTLSKLAVAIALTCLVSSTFADRDRPRPPDEGRHGGGMRMTADRGGAPFMERFKEENPEEFERLMQIRDENPEEFREQLRNYIRNHSDMAKRREENAEKHREIRQLAAQYHEAENDEEREELEGEIRELLNEAFEARLDADRQVVEDLEDRVAEMKERIDKQEESRDEIIEWRLQMVTRDPDLR